MIDINPPTAAQIQWQVASGQNQSTASFDC